MTTYLLDGQEAQGGDYVAPLESLSDDEVIEIAISDGRGLTVSICSDGYFVTEERADGSAYLTTNLTKERVRKLIDAFLSNAEDWRAGLEWELTSLPPRRLARRILGLVLMGTILAIAAWWLTRNVPR